MELAPLYIRVHPNDNVAIVVNDGGLGEGATFADGLTLLERVPQGHKVALRDLAEGDEVIRYNVVIGYATKALPRGSWVNEHVIRMPTPPALDDLPMATIPARLDELPQDRPLVCICHHGVRSQQVAYFLERQGFTQVINMQGGVAAWADLVDPSMPRY